MDPRSRYSESVIERLTLEDYVEVKRKVKFSSVQQQHLTFNQGITDVDPKTKLRYKIAARAGKEVQNGMNINLGIGIPTILPEVIPTDVKIFIQSENGVLGVGHHPSLDEVDPDDINAGKVGMYRSRKPSLLTPEDLISRHQILLP